MAGGDDRTWGSATDDPWRDDLGDDDYVGEREDAEDIDAARRDATAGRNPDGESSEEAVPGGAAISVVLQSPDEEPDDLDDFDEEDFDDDFDDDFEEESEDEYEMDNEEYPDDDFGEGTDEDDLDGVDLDEEIGIEGEEAATGEEELIESGEDAEETGEAEAGFEE
ncbi:MAG: hypothetical protein AB7O38_14425 [Pirellulaceae bacterium]